MQCILLAAIGLLFILTACGGSGSASTPVASSAALPVTSTAESSRSAEAADAADGIDASETGIDQTKLDVCALVPRASVEAVIGPLAKTPKSILPIGNEVGCDYASDTRAAIITVYNLDRWDLFTQGLDGRSVADIGDGGWLVKEVDGSHTLYVLLRDRAVVGVSLSGENMQEFRQLVDAAQAQIQ